MAEPKNGLYLTNADFPQWQDDISNYINSYSYKMNSNCKGCNESSCHNCNEASYISGIKAKNITFVVTEKCNLNCSYCYEMHKTGIRMTKEIAKEAVDFIFDENKVNGYYDKETSPAVIIEFIGGEPFLEVDLIDYISEYFKKKAFELNHPWAVNYMFSLTTNGTLYKTEKVQKYLKRNPGKVSVGITIDGNKELHDSCRVFHDGSGSYDIVEESVKLWIQNESNPQTKITLSPTNVGFLNDAIKNVKELGINGAFTNCVFEEGWTIDHAKILYSEMIKLADYLLNDETYKNFFCSLFDESIGEVNTSDNNWCGGDGQMLAIGPDGRCFPCIRFMKYALGEPGRKEQPIGDIWNGLDNKEDNKWLKKLTEITATSQCQYEDNKKCLDCEIATGCALCTGYNYDKFGTPNHKATFICDMHKARVLANTYFWNKLYKKLNIDNKCIFNLNIRKELALEILTEKEYNELIELTKR